MRDRLTSKTPQTDRTFGKLPKPPVPTLWIAGLAYLLAISLFCWLTILGNHRDFCGAPEPMEYINLLLHGAAILACFIYVARYRRQIGLVVAPVVVVALLSTAFIFDAHRHGAFDPPSNDPHAVRFCFY